MVEDMYNRMSSICNLLKEPASRAPVRSLEAILADLQQAATVLDQVFSRFHEQSYHTPLS